MRRYIKFGLVLLAGTILAYGEPSVVNGILVIVNSAIITAKDIQDYTRSTADTLERAYASQPRILKQKLDDMQKDALEQLVERQLILHDFKTAGYNIPESIIDEEIEGRIRKQYGDRLTLTRTLLAEGMTTESFKQQVRDEIIVDALTQKNVSSEILISPHKIEQYYADNKDQFKVEDQVQLRMIIINQASGDDPGKAKRMASEIIIELDRGVPFAEMAALYSDGNRKDAGAPVWWEKAQLRQEIADVAFKMEKGKHSGVIETPTACYLIQLEDKKAAGVKALSEVREEIEKILLTKERARLRQKYTDRLKKKSYIRYF